MDIKLVTSEIINVLNRSGDQELDDLFKMVGKMHSDLDSKTFSSYLMEMEIQGLVSARADREAVPQAVEHREAVRQSEGMAAAGWPQGQGFTSGLNPCLVEPHLHAGCRCISCDAGYSWSGSVHQALR